MIENQDHTILEERHFRSDQGNETDPLLAKEKLQPTSTPLKQKSSISLTEPADYTSMFLAATGSGSATRPHATRSNRCEARRDSLETEIVDAFLSAASSRVKKEIAPIPVAKQVNNSRTSSTAAAVATSPRNISTFETFLSFFSMSTSSDEENENEVKDCSHMFLSTIDRSERSDRRNKHRQSDCTVDFLATVDLAVSRHRPQAEANPKVVTI